MPAPDPDAPAVLSMDLFRRCCTPEMVGADGRVVAYHLEPDHKPGEWAVIVRRLDGERGPYRVWKERGRLWRCTCESFRYRKGPFAPYGCRHTAYVSLFRHESERLTPDPTVIPMAKTNDKPSPPRQTDTAAPPTADTPAGQAAPQTAEMIRRRLADPFPAGAVGWKPQSVKGNRCLAVAYIDARDVCDRLDDVVGVDGWQDEYVALDGGNVRCKLSLRIGGEWIAKEDVGGESDQKDHGDKTKAAYSDALKRAAVKWGIGRFLYSLPVAWVDYDPQKQQIVRPPALPAWALPGGSGRPPGTTAPREPGPQPTATVIVGGAHVAGPAPTAAPPSDFHRRLQEHDGALADQGLCKAGDLVKYVATMAKAGGYVADMTAWSTPEIELALKWAGDFETARLAAEAAALLPRKGQTIQDLAGACGGDSAKALAQWKLKPLREGVAWLRRLGEVAKAS